MKNEKRDEKKIAHTIQGIDSVNKQIQTNINLMTIGKVIILVCIILLILQIMIELIKQTQQNNINAICCNDKKCPDVTYDYETNTCVIKTCKPYKWIEDKCVWQGNITKLPLVVG